MAIEVAFRHSFGQGTMDVAFSAPTPGVTVLFGPSGAGKSTVVAMLAGLLRPVRARLVIDGAVLCDSDHRIWLPPESRRLGVVFQDARLFPHLSVRGNLMYGLRRAPPGPVGLPRVVDLLGIGELLARQPHTLSGGERQRVAIGRAVLSQPRLLLMDEPLASLDDARRAEILPFVATLARELRIPVVYVTHAAAELAALADNVVLLAAGRVVASGTLHNLTTRGDLPLAVRDDAAAILAITMVAHDSGRRLSTVQSGATRLLVPLSALPIGATARLVVPAAEIILARTHPEIAISVQNIIAGHVRGLNPQPARQAVMVEVSLDAQTTVLARITPDAVQRLALTPGAPIIVLVKSTALRVLA